MHALCEVLKEHAVCLDLLCHTIHKGQLFNPLKHSIINTVTCIPGEDMPACKPLITSDTKLDISGNEDTCDPGT